MTLIDICNISSNKFYLNNPDDHFKGQFIQRTPLIQLKYIAKIKARTLFLSNSLLLLINFIET